MARKKKLFSLSMVTFLVISAFFAHVASAHNSHQDHQGACARSTTSISVGVGDLRYNGVLGQDAADMGIVGLNGSITYQMDNQLVVATVVHAVTTHNHGCDGHGHTFDAGLRTLYAGEKVIVKRPAKFDKSIVCGHPSSRCKRVTFRTCTALPASCWNENNGCMTVAIWIKKAHGKKGAVRIRKIAEDANHHSIPVPTGIFRFRVSAMGYHTKVVTLNSSSQSVGSYRVGTKVTITELKPLGNDQWTLVNPNQHQTVGSKGATFTFKNVEVAQSPPPQSPPPSSNNCSNVANGNNNSQGGNCNNCTGTDVCNTVITPPGCTSNCTQPPRHNCRVEVSPLVKDDRSYTFTATSTDGPIESVDWRFSDGTTDTGVSVEHTFLEWTAGTTVSATATVTFSDTPTRAACTGTATIPPYTGDPPPPPPPGS